MKLKLIADPADMVSSIRLRVTMYSSSLSVLLCYCPLLLLLLVPISECFSWSSSSNRLNINNHSRQLYLLKAAASSTSSHVAKDNDITARQERLQTLANLANNALDEHGSEILKTFNARVGVIDPSDNKNDDFQSNYLRLGLISTQSYSKGDQLIATLPYYENDGTSLCISSNMATKIVYKDVLPEGYDGWTGDVGLLAWYY
jgi:type II secretory pathway pseudopilin PulG